MAVQKITVFILLMVHPFNSICQINKEIKNEPIRGKMMVRIAEIEIHPEYLEEYMAILKEESEASVRLEPGVICIYPMFRKENPAQIRILEIYADSSAYETHLLTTHFKKYKALTLKMVKSLELIDMKALDIEAMPEIFSKLN